ncbi:pro-FMRFamide-related neuropeptide VF [Cynoglossus semilaevis]|uniref:LPXRFa peptide n=1 Tax=Cynoglossus semilaevis TaxID=244447 RepID=A0A0Y0G6Q3_CYNSE|nr:uncharacterized protein LOC107989993 [Cynoglossus semilaevis]AMB48604.1 LPXRFa peptide [Cynoglossus semilaevis]
MLSTVFLSVLLMLGGPGGAAAAADFQVYGKSAYSDKSLPSSEEGRHTVRRQPLQQAKAVTRRSLDLERLNMRVTPTASKSSLPTIIKLYPPTVNPHIHANMPMRFGREVEPEDDQSHNTPNMPQRFGRAWTFNRVCVKCRGDADQVLPGTSLYWSLINSLAVEQFFNTDLHWAEDFDLTANAEELEMERTSFKG